MGPVLAFAGYEYYPGGGMHDFKGAFPTTGEACAYLVNEWSSSDWFHVLDISTGLVLKPVYGDLKHTGLVTGWSSYTPEHFPNA